MAATSIQCQFHACKNRVTPASEYYPYCHIHAQYSIQYLNEQNLLGQSGTALGLTQAEKHVDHLDQSNDVVIKHYLASALPSLPESDVERMRLAFERFYSADPDRYRTPIYSRQDARKAALDLRTALIDGGFDGERVGIAQVRGAHRRVPFQTKTIDDPDFTHEVVIISVPGRSEEIIVDPTISGLAPVPNLELEVDEQIDSGTTPFGDCPWVGLESKYTAGDHLWWDSIIHENDEPR